MRIRRLRLENYRRYRSLDLEFPDGVIALVGPNGSGKSTLLEAVTWCLFGHEGARTGKDLIKTSAAAPGEDTTVHLEFELDGNAYGVTRRMRGKSLQADATVECNGTLLVSPGANSADQAAQLLARVLGMDRVAFQSTVEARQGDLSALSDRTPSVRKKLILGMLGVEDVETAIQLVRAHKRENAVRLEELRRALSREAELRQRAAELDRQLREARGEARRWSEEHQRRAARAATMADQAADLERRQQRHRELRGRLDSLQRVLDGIQKQRLRTGAELQLLSEKDAERIRLEAQAGRFADFESRWGQWEAHRSQTERRRGLEEGLARVQTELSRWRTHAGPNGSNGHHLEALQSRLAELHQRTEVARETAARLRARAAVLDGETRRVQLEAAGEQDRWRDVREHGPQAPCPTCERPLGDVYEALAHHAAEHQELTRDRLKALRTESETLRRREEEAQRAARESQEALQRDAAALTEAQREAERRRLAAAEAERLERDRAALESELAQLPLLAASEAAEAELRKQRGEYDQWRESLVRLQEALQRAPRLREELATLKAEEEDARNEIVDASRELAALAYVEGSLESARRAWEQERTRVQEAERESSRLEERGRVLGDGLAAAQQDLEHLDQARSHAEAAEAALRVDEVLAADRGDAGLLPDFKNHLIARIRPALARATARLVAEMTGGRYTEVELDDEYGLRLFDGAAAWPLARFSGGEADVANLALRLAVSELVAAARGTARPQCVVLDEVLANQDETRRRSILAALKGLGAHFRQVFLVTHWEEVREGVDHVVRMLPQPDGSSRVWSSWEEKV